MSSMMYYHADSLRRLHEYAARQNRTLAKRLGWGQEGVVYSTISRTAIKAFRSELHYSKERDVYFRLFERGVNSVAGCAVPQLVAHDDVLMVVEMTIVSPPYVLDFAGAYLDELPPFSAEKLEEWEADRRELFEDRWPRVLSILSAFRRHGICSE
jgi:hypothetical protein